MLDRLISGAGALTDRADRLVRALTSGRGPDIMGNRPGSVLAIVIMPFRGPRPALRVEAGTGTLLLSFDSKESRDRAAAELIGEAGLLIRDTGIAASPG